MIDCPELQDGFCKIASTLAGTQAQTWEDSCLFCTNRADPSRAINRVTVSLAIGASEGNQEKIKELLSSYGHYLRKLRQKNDSERLVAILEGTGPGSQLWNLLNRLGIEHDPNCSCLAWAELMNRWGVESCKRAKGLILEHVRASARAYKWTTVVKAAVRSITLVLSLRLNPLKPYESLIDEAIRLAEIAEEQQQCQRSGPTG